MAETNLSGAEILARTLLAEGVDCIFGLPGTQNVPTFEAFRERRLRTVLCTHELGAAFMANGYSRATGRVGVLATIPGPGFTYALPGIAEARLDSVPLLHIAGQPPPGERGRFRHQGIPQASMVEDLVKEVVQVDRADQMREGVRHGLSVALEGDPGPVLLHVAREAQSGSVTSPSHPTAWRRPDRDAVSPVEINDLVQRVERARRPVLFIGRGARSAAPLVRALVDKLGAPFFSTPSGRGVVDERDRRCLGFDPDRGGVSALNELLRESDLILALGCRMSFNGTAGFGLELAPGKLAHINTDREALHGMRPAGLALKARVEDVVPELLARIEDGSTRWGEAELEEWRSRVKADWKQVPPEPRYHGVPGGRPEAFFEALREVLPANGVVVVDSGLHQVMTRRHFVVTEPDGLIAPFDFQSMGFAVPAAIGAAIGTSRPVVAVVGDGGFAMAAMELLTALREGVALVVVVVNDGFLNLIRLQQFGDGEWSHAVRLRNPDFETLAASLGVGYARIDGDPEGTLRDALDQDVPVIVELVAGDSVEIRKAKVVGFSRNVARRMVGPTLRGRLRRLWAGL